MSKLYQNLAHNQLITDNTNNSIKLQALLHKILPVSPKKPDPSNKESITDISQNSEKPLNSFSKTLLDETAAESLLQELSVLANISLSKENNSLNMSYSSEIERMNNYSNSKKKTDNDAYRNECSKYIGKIRKIASGSDKSLTQCNYISTKFVNKDFCQSDELLQNQKQALNWTILDPENSIQASIDKKQVSFQMTIPNNQLESKKALTLQSSNISLQDTKSIENISKINSLNSQPNLIASERRQTTPILNCDTTINNNSASTSHRPISNTIINSRNTPILTSRSKKKHNNKETTNNLLEKNLRKYETSMELMNRFTTSNIVDKFEKSPEGHKIMALSVNLSTRDREQINHSSSEENPMKLQKLRQIFDNVITVDPASLNKPDDGSERVISIYQYVTEKYDNGNKYEGEKLLGKRHGNGTYYYKEGHKYIGCWKDDKICGFGILWFNENIKWYEGEWNDNNFNGNGTLYNIKPDFMPFEFDGKNFLVLGDHWLQYQGEFHKGKKNGFGVLRLSNGDIFIGHFINDTIHGRGSYTKNGGQAFAGIWACNQLSLCF